MSNAAKLLQEQKHLIPVNAPVPNRRILVVDDEPEIATGIQRILSPEKSESSTSMRSSRSAKKDIKTASKSEFEIVVFNNPHDALAEVKKSIEDNNAFAMGFFDVMLGADIDGIELVKQIMAIDHRMFAVFVTAYHDRSVDIIGSYLGHDNRERWDYINKPFNEGEILQKARNATSLWDLHQLRQWQAERLSEAHQLLLTNERHNAAAAVARSVAHEFGNLLTHIIGHAELAKLTNDPQQIYKSLDVILKAGDTASSILKNFRKLNELGESQEVFEPINIQKIVEEAIELMEFRFRRHGIIVDSTKVNSVQAEVVRSSLIQVFANLFINSIHAMHESGGTLYLELDKVENNFELKIRDTGHGIPEDIIDQVTQPLFTTKGSNGSGLGLSICKEIVEIKHFGQFKIENYPAGGAQVTISIPCEREVENDI